MTALAVTLSVTFVFAIALALPIIMVLALIVLIGVFAVLVVLIPVLVVVTFVLIGVLIRTGRRYGRCSGGRSRHARWRGGRRRRRSCRRGADWTGSGSWRRTRAVFIILVLVVVLVFLFSACGRRRWRQLGRRARRRRSAFVILGRCAGTRISGACQRGQSANKQSHSGYRKRKKAELLKHEFTLRSSVLQSTVAFGRHLLHPKPKFASVNCKRLGEGLLL